MLASIPPEIEQYVEHVVATGRYESAEQVIREAFRLLQEKDRQFESVRADIKAGFDQLERGQEHVRLGRLKHSVAGLVAHIRDLVCPEVIRAMRGQKELGALEPLVLGHGSSLSTPYSTGGGR